MYLPLRTHEKSLLPVNVGSFEAQAGLLENVEAVPAFPMRIWKL
jgi:hypothetical protein